MRDRRTHETVHERCLQPELFGIGDVLQGAAAALAEMLAARSGYFTPSNSTSNTSVAFGGMTPPTPRAP